MSEVVPSQSSAVLLAANSSAFAAFLTHHGLPCDNIIATVEERQLMAANLPSLLQSLPASERAEARYLSKFVGATAIGLFDAALNYVWNEVVLNLQRKATVYGLGLFFDAAVGGDRREYYKNEDDFRNLKDRVILDTFLKLELLSHVVYKKLEHILTMRNEVAASHPNVEKIGTFELLGWLQTCVKDVLQDKPSDSAIKISSLVSSLRSSVDILDSETVARFSAELKNLAPAHIQNLLLTIFGIYVAEGTNPTLKKNVSLIAPSVWACAVSSIRYKIGERIDGFRTNLQQTQLANGTEFLLLVDGLNYESLPQKELALRRLAEKLNEVHDGWDNFYNEPPVMKEILAYCKETRDIPPEARYPLCEVVVKCRLGRGLNYNRGVSPGGAPLYEVFLSLLDDKGIVDCLRYLSSQHGLARLSNSIRLSHLPPIIKIFSERAISERIRTVLGSLTANPAQAQNIFTSREFAEMMHPL